METVMASIISALISGMVAIIVCIINANSNHKKLLLELEKQNEMQMYRIEQLEKKVDKHNNHTERIYKLEEQSAVFAEKISVANHRIDDLEKK